MSGETVPVRDLARTTRAMDFDDYSGVAFADESKAGGEVVEGSAGDWVSFTGASWGSRLTASVASASGGSFEVRRGSPTGTLLATVQVPATGGIYQYGTVNAAVKAGAGSVYLVFKGNLRIKGFAFAR
ncbi:carbohydrate-binding protein [Nonomuraea thailandensis]